MAAALDDAALVHDEDFVGVGHGREAMRDNQRRDPLGQAVEARLDGAFGGAVEGRGGLVEDEQPGPLEPSVGFQKKKWRRATVDLPAPVGPANATFSPGRKVKSMRPRIGRLPW